MGSWVGAVGGRVGWECGWAGRVEGWECRAEWAYILDWCVYAREGAAMWAESEGERGAQRAVKAEDKPIGVFGEEWIGPGR